MANNLVSLLDTVYIANQQLDVIDAEFDNEIRMLLGHDLYEKMQEAKHRHDLKTQLLQQDIDALTQQAKDLALAAGATVNGKYISAVYTKPRVTWDTKGLEGYAVAHPEIASFRKVGSPSITLRRL